MTFVTDSEAALGERPAALETAAAVEPFPWASLAIASLALASESVSIAMCVAQFALGDRLLPYIRNDLLEPEARSILWTLSALAFVLPLPFALASLLQRRAEAVAPLVRLSRLLSPLLLAWALPTLFSFQFAGQHPVIYLALVAGATLLMERLLRISLDAVPPELGQSVAAFSGRISARSKRIACLGIAAFAAACYATYTAYFSILQHRRFHTSGYDLGIYNSLLANFLSGHFFRSPVLSPDIGYLSNHSELGALYLIPFFAAFPRAETLLVIQSLALGFAAVPLYLFAATQLPRASAAVIAVAYLLFAPLHGPNFYDFHWMPFAVPIWFLLFFAVAKRKYWLIWLAVALVLPVREETGLLLAAFGLLLIVTSYSPKLGAAFIGTGFGWYALMRLVVIPSFGSWGFEGIYGALIAPGEKGVSSIIRTLLTNPNYVWKTLATEPKLIYALHMLGPLVFLPARRLAFVALLVPGSLFTLFTTNYAPTVSIAFQYTTHWIPWLFLGTVLSLRLLSRGERPIVFRRAAVLALLFGVTCHSYAFGALLQRSSFVGGFHRVSFGMTEIERQNYANFRRLLAMIPEDASVAATDPQSPHLGRRTNAYSLRITHGNADYLLISAPNLSSDDRAHARQALEHESFGLLASAPPFYVFKRGHVSDQTEAALQALKLGGSAPPRSRRPRRPKQ